MIRIAAFALVLSAASMGNAVPMLQGSTSAVTGILRLDVGGFIYDVTFSNGSISFLTEFGGANPTFSGDQAGAASAASAIASLFNAQGVTGVTDLTGASGEFLLHVVWGVLDPLDVASARYRPPTWDSVFGGLDQNDFGPNVSWVRFSLVPEPSTLALLGAGLLALACRRYYATCRGATSSEQ